MKDKEFLKWLHERLVNIYNEDPLMDYMHKLRAIIRDTDDDSYSPNTNTGNSLKDIE